MSILCFIDEFCRTHGIAYSLAYGTMLGAVRHKGFIPWDDDIDIWMSRKDYEFFVSSFNYNNSSKYKLISYRDGSYVRNCSYAKVIDTTTAAYEEPLKPGPYEGIWVDVFPLDYVPEGRLKREALYCRLLLDAKIIVSRTALKPKAPYKILKFLTFWRRNKKVLSSADRYGKSAKESAFCQTLSQLSLHSFRSMMPVTWVAETESVPFEGFEFPIYKHFDEILRLIYGDYMRLPPPEKRVSHTIEAYSLID